jgi:hypothetical protein
MKQKSKKSIIEEMAVSMGGNIAEKENKIKEYLKVNGQGHKQGEALEKAILYGWDDIIDNY